MRREFTVASHWKWLGVFALLLAVFLSALPVTAQEGGGEAVATRLRYEDENGDRQPVQGATVRVERDGETIGEGTTDAEGNFELPVPGPGSYTLILDLATIPDGVFIRESGREVAVVEVLLEQTGRAIFALSTAPTVSPEAGDVGGVVSFSMRALVQLTVEGIKLGLFLAMAAIGLSLIFGTTGLTNFAHGEMIGFGMLMAYFFNFFGLAGVFGFLSGLPPPFGAGVNLIIAIVIATALGGGLGWLMDRVIFMPLRTRGVSVIAQMVVTIGLAILIRYMYLFSFGGSPRFYADYTAQAGISIGMVTITPKDLISGLLSLMILVGVGLFLNYTRMGKAMRAVSDNRDLAESSGIDVQRVIRFVWVSGGALAALGGAFIGLSEQVAWNTGFRFLLLIFAGVILGGLGTAYGALVGCLLVGVGIQVSTLFIPTELKNVGALAVLILVLVFRPQGILGRAERIG